MSFSRQGTSNNGLTFGQSRERLVDQFSVQSSSDENHQGNRAIERVLKVVSYALIVLTFPLSLIYCVAVVKEYERVVIFRMGRIAPGCPKGPGLFLVIPCLDSLVKVDLRTFNFTIPLAEVMLKDSIPISVEAVVYGKVCSVIVAVSHVEDYGQSTRLMAASTLRKVLGSRNLADVLSDRNNFSRDMTTKINEATVRMGIRVERVELKSMSLAPHLRRAMAVEGIAGQEARANVAFAQGEKDAAGQLAEAASIMSPAALQLRYMQSLNSIQHNTDRGSTLLFPIPMRMGVGKPFC